MKNNITMRDIAKAAGVSLATVSRAMHNTGYVTEEKRRLIFDTAQKENLNILTFPVDELTNQTLLQTIPIARKANPVGIIIIGSMDEAPDPQLNALLHDSPIPIICIGHTSNYYNFNRIIVDNTKGVYLATQHLLKRGHKSLLYVSSLSLGQFVMQERLNGFTAALSSSSDPDVRHQILQLSDSNTEVFDAPHIYQSFKRIFEKNPDITGIVNWSDGLAAIELQCLYDMKIPVPKQVEIIGFDDILAPYLAPPLSSIQMPYNEMADSALQIVADCRRSSSLPLTKTIVLIPKLIIR